MSFPQAIACEPVASQRLARFDPVPCHARRRYRPGALRVSTQEQTAQGSSQYVSAEAIAQEYGVPVSQVHRGAREGWLPVMKFGRYSRFDPEKVKAALEARNDA